MPNIPSRSEMIKRSQNAVNTEVLYGPRPTSEAFKHANDALVLAAAAEAPSMGSMINLGGRFAASVVENRFTNQEAMHLMNGMINEIPGYAEEGLSTNFKKAFMQGFVQQNTFPSHVFHEVLSPMTPMIMNELSGVTLNIAKYQGRKPAM